MSSILVRKHCQPVLDEAGYPMFHCTLDDNHYEPAMVIYTSCGRKMVEVQGVKFSRAKPTISECEYSAVLLKDWITRHAADFEAYTDAYVEFYSTKPPKYINKKKGSEIVVKDKINKIIEIIRSFPVPDEKTTNMEDTFCFKTTIQLPKEEGDVIKIRSIFWPTNIKLTPAEITAKLRIPKYLIDAAEQLLIEQEEYSKVVKAFEKAKAKIETCEI